VHLTEFNDALSYGQVLLTLDVPASSVAKTEAIVHHRHPEAAVGGVSWAIDALNILRGSLYGNGDHAAALSGKPGCRL
jgi:hypothetical protein